MKDLTFKTSATSTWAYDSITEPVENAPGDKIEKAHDLAVVAKEHEQRLAEWPDFTRESFARLYRPGDEENRLPPDESTAWAMKAHRVIETTGSFAELREASAAHSSIAADSAAMLARAAAEALGLGKLPAKTDAAKDPADCQRRARRLRKLAEAMKDDGDEDASDEAVDAAKDAEQEARMANARRSALSGQIDSTSFAQAMAKSVEIAARIAQDKAEAVAMLRGFGLGGESIDGEEEIDPELLKLIMANEDLAAILQMLGRVKEASARGGLTKIGDGRCDVVGIRPGREIEHLIGAELARFAIPELADETLSRVLDGTALTWDLQGEDERDCGDLLLFVDNSPSMEGDRMTFARATAAAAMLRAVDEKRRVFFVLFNTTAKTVIIDPPTAAADLVDALKLLAEPTQGGTNAEGAMKFGSDLLTKRGTGRDHVDTLMLTDGGFPKPVPEVIAALKRDGGRVHVCLIGDDSAIGDGHKWADAIHTIEDAALDDADLAAKIVVGTARR